MTMTTSAPALPVPSRVGQGTAVEQARAIAEVQAAIVVAQQCPRDIRRAISDMQRSCAQKSLAERAFFRYSRGGSQITGPSVQLARELARCWGNIQYGLTELRRDDTYGQSEMQAWAWDVQTNARSSTTFIVPHRRDKTGGPVALTEMRDIYENNANNGARRLREMIFAILPGWYTEDATAACYATLAADDADGSLAERIKAAADSFARIGVTGAQLEQKLGAPQSKWTPYDLAQLRIIYRSLERGESRKDEEFPSAQSRVTAAEVTAAHAGDEPGEAAKPARKTRRRPAPAAAAPDGQPASGPAADAGPDLPPPPGDDEPSDDPAERHRRLVGVVQGRFKRLGFSDDDKAERLWAAAKLAGTGEIASLNDLDPDELSTVADALAKCRDRKRLEEVLAAAGEQPGGGHG
jgi:hypothetical protein